MIKIDDKKVSDSVRRIWRDLAASGDAPRVLKTVRDHVSTGVIRHPDAVKRIGRILDEADTLPDWLRDLLLEVHPACPLVSLLDPDVLQQQLPALAGYFGKPGIKSALLLDGRDSVRCLALDPLSKTHPLDMDAALEALAGRLMPACAPLLGPAPAASAADVVPQVPDPAGVETLQRELEHARAATRRAEAQVEEREALAKDKQNRITKLTADRERARQTVRDLEQAMKLLKAEQTAALEAETRRRIEEEAAAWLAPARAREADLKAALERLAPLMDRVGDWLRIQAERDRQYGNRQELRRQLTEVEGAERALLEVAEHSLQPQPDLKGLLTEVQVEKHRLRDQLGMDQDRPGEIEERLLARIQSAENLAGLDHWQERVRTLVSWGVLPDRETVRLERALLHHRGRLSAGAFDEPAAAEDPNPFFSLYSILRRQVAARLWIDGHNLGRVLETRFTGNQPTETPDAKLRSHVREVMEALATRHPRLDIRLFFDGPDPTREQPLPNLTVQFSGGQGSNRADDVIVRELERAEMPHPFVATSDLSLQARVVACGARPLTVHQLGALLEESGVLRGLPG